MAWDTDAAHTKRDELQAAIMQFIHEHPMARDSVPAGGIVTSAAEEFLRAFVRIIPPEAAEPRMELIVMSRFGKDGGRSTKPGNVRLNIGQLINSLASGVLTVAGVWTAPWLAPLAALVIWNDLYARATVELSKDHATVIWAMWLHADPRRTVGDSDLLHLVNGERAKAGELPFDRIRLDEVLAGLAELRCIERSRQDTGRWWLREWVSVNYR